jgi:hypothetical protein
MPKTTLMWLMPFTMRVARPMARGRQRLILVLGPMSTVIVSTYRELSSKAEEACLALAMADSNNFRTGRAAALFVNFKTSSAAFTSIPRTRSAITRTLRGDILTKRALALASIKSSPNFFWGGKSAFQKQLANFDTRPSEFILFEKQPFPVLCLPQREALITTSKPARQGNPQTNFANDSA